MTSDTPQNDVNTTATSSSPLLDKLPAELRNLVYRLVLTFDDNIKINHPAASQERTALLRTCTLIRQEATAIYYSENTFHTTYTIGEDSPVIAWLKANAANAGHVRDLVMSLDVPEALADSLDERLKKCWRERDEAAARKFCARELGMPMLDFARRIASTDIHRTNVASDGTTAKIEGSSDRLSASYLFQSLMGLLGKIDVDERLAAYQCALENA